MEWFPSENQEDVSVVPFNDIFETNIFHDFHQQNEVPTFQELISKIVEQNYCPHCDITFCYESEFMAHQQEWHLQSILKIDDYDDMALSSHTETEVAHCVLSEEFDNAIAVPILQVIGGYDNRHSEIEKTIISTNTKEPMEKTIDCKICHEKFYIKYDLYRHLASHDEKPFSCGLCEKKFKEIGALNHHLVTHKNEKPFSCKTCNKTFKRKGHLTEHMAGHKNGKSFTCAVCRKKFTQKSVMNRHLLIHSNEKPYPCKICGKTFRENNHLNRHLVVHNNEKPYPCEICRRAFTQRGYLKIHMLIHKNEKPFLCQFCKKGFRKKFNLQLHVDQKHVD